MDDTWTIGIRICRYNSDHLNVIGLIAGGTDFEAKAFTWAGAKLIGIAD